ncbi:MAG: choice-of-anchor D domain-containing protein [Candidatus Sulfotelmatobacter sp.]
MKRPTTDHAPGRTIREPFAAFSFGGEVNSLLLFLLASLIVLSACGGSSSSSNQLQSSGQLAGNWQFSIASPPDGSFQGSPSSPCATGTTSPLCSGGFLLTDNNGAVTGQITYAIFLPAQSGGAPTICNSGSTPVVGTVSGQNVTLTAVEGKQTYTLTGVLNGTTMMGTYTSTDGKGCGTAQSGLQWSATYVPLLTGTIQGTFHSTAATPLRNQLFPVTGTLVQGDNVGASSATVTGTLSFQNYPCLSSASVNGQVSGSSVILEIVASNGLNVGQIGAPVGFSNPNPVTVLSSAAGVVLQGATGYGVSTSACPGANTAGDTGDVCLGVGNTTSCTQPILFSPASLTFPPELVGSAPTTQMITLTNNNISSTPLTGLTLTLNPQSGPSDFNLLSDFDGLPNFTEQDNCASSPGSTFTLAPQQSCIITIAFSPQQSCPWMPSTGLGGEPPSSCPFPLQASLTVNSPVSADSDTSFAIPITGSGYSAIFPGVFQNSPSVSGIVPVLPNPELDFGAEALGEKSVPQLLTFVNQGTNAVQILPALSTPCMTPPTTSLSLPRPLAPGEISGLQVVASFTANASTFTYGCDSDLTSQQPNFQISNDNCSGTLLPPLASCSLDITFALQPHTSLAGGLDYFLELNTLQCTGTVTSNCEIDSGRYPVELKANTASTLRMSPAAGLNFGAENVGLTTPAMTVTLFNDPKDPNAATVNFTGSVLQGTNFAETDNCVGSLAPGSSCVVTVTFTPLKAGFTKGTVTIGYTPGQTQTIYLRGTGQ